MAKDNERSALYETTTSLQKVAGVGAIGFAIAALGLVSKWMAGSDTDEAYLGGLNWKDLLFNYHPIFMVAGLVFASLTALLSYRLVPLPKPLTKTLHGLLHTAALCCVVTGLTCVVLGNNDPEYNNAGMRFANLASLHSWLGLAAVALYFQNYLLGLLAFALPPSLVSLDLRAAYLPWHVLLGSLTLVAAVLAAETGVMELSAELGCGYEVHAADTNPAAHYHLLADGCKTAYGAGMCIFVAATLGGVALFDGTRFSRRRAGGKAEGEVANALEKSLLLDRA